MRTIKTGYLYIIESVKQNAVKLGFAVDPTTRIAPLRTGNPDPLEFRIMIRATLDAEQYIQRRLKPFSISREWYPDDGLLDILFDDLLDETFDRATEKYLQGAGEFQDLVEEEVATYADAKRVVPSIIKEHSVWVAEGRPVDDLAV